MWIFEPILKSTIWGGSNIYRLKSFEGDANGSIGESWEVSDVPGDESVVVFGPDKGLTLHELIKKYGKALMGKAELSEKGRFPLMVKIIDASEDLSVQVHPNGQAAALFEGEEKNEFWYVMNSHPGASVINGFVNSVSKDDLSAACGTADILPLLQRREATEGSSFFIPAGRVHAIGGGVTLLEIQQTSSTTYRVYDYDRVDCNGERRELHLNEAMKSINYSDNSGCDDIIAKPENDKRINLVDLPYFTVNVLSGNKNMRPDYSDIDSFKIISVVKGSAAVKSANYEVCLRAGNTVLLGANEKDVCLTPGPEGFEVVEVYKNF